MPITIKIGRDNSNDIIINEVRVSRNHAIISRIDEITFEIKDLGSTNGTFVNGVRISGQTIKPGDKVEIAGSIINWLEAFNTPKKQDVSVLEEEPFAGARKTITVGSSVENDVIVDNSFVSGKHATISLLRNGNYFIRDLGSSNGTFVNNTKVLSKNFNKTDVVRLGSAELPSNWFKNKKLRPRFIHDNKKAILISASLLIVFAGAAISYQNRCAWFDTGCKMPIAEISTKSSKSIVHIKHSYYYTIDHNGKQYYVGRNKIFKGTEANTSIDNILPYDTISGNGCFISKDGNILTTGSTINPWLNVSTRKKMLVELKESKTLPAFSSLREENICGKTAELQFLSGGSVNNDHNYINATAKNQCSGPDSSRIIRSVKNTLPGNAEAAVYYYNPNTKDKIHRSVGHYYSKILPLHTNSLLKDTLYYVRDSSIITSVTSMTVPDTISNLPEGSIVLNDRGELIGIVDNSKVELLPGFINQIKK